MNDQEDLYRAVRLIRENVKTIEKRVEKLENKPTVPIKEDWMDGQAVKLALNISTRTLRTLRDSEVLIPSQIRGKYYYKVSDIKTLLEENYIRYHLSHQK